MYEEQNSRLIFNRHVVKFHGHNCICHASVRGYNITRVACSQVCSIQAVVFPLICYR